MYSILIPITRLSIRDRKIISIIKKESDLLKYQNFWSPGYSNGIEVHQLHLSKFNSLPLLSLQTQVGRLV